MATARCRTLSAGRAWRARSIQEQAGRRISRSLRHLAHALRNSGNGCGGGCDAPTAPRDTTDGGHGGGGGGSGGNGVAAPAGDVGSVVSEAHSGRSACLASCARLPWRQPGSCWVRGRGMGRVRRDAVAWTCCELLRHFGWEMWGVPRRCRRRCYRGRPGGSVPLVCGHCRPSHMRRGWTCSSLGRGAVGAVGVAVVSKYAVVAKKQGHGQAIPPAFPARPLAMVLAQSLPPPHSSPLPPHPSPHLHFCCCWRPCRCCPPRPPRRPSLAIRR